MALIELVENAWDRTAESVALQHNSEVKCALQLAVNPLETVGMDQLRYRLVDLTDGAGDMSLPETREIAKTIRDCLIPNGTFEAVEDKPLRVRKLVQPDQDALAGHHLRISADTPFGLKEMLGRTNIATGQRRAPHFSLGILREQAKAEMPLNLPVLAERLHTSSATILGHVRNLGRLGVITYSKVAKAEQIIRPETARATRTAIELSPAYLYVVRRLINSVEGVTAADPVAIGEGQEAGQAVLQNPELLSRLLDKRFSR